MKPSFTLLEIIFVISIISIISYLLLTNSFKSLNKANTVKIKSELSLIRLAIQENFTSNILLGKTQRYIEFLDKAKINTFNQTLFDGYKNTVLLKNIILSSTRDKKDLAKWIKISQRKYRIYISSNDYVDFTYDNNIGTFSCVFTKPLCKELNE